MYQIISALNGFIRDEMVPNPFEFISNNSLVVLLIYSFIGEKVISRLAFYMCEIFYTRGGNKTLGSIGHLFFYLLNVMILIKLQEIIQNVTLILSFYTIIIFILYVGLRKIKKVVSEY